MVKKLFAILLFSALVLSLFSSLVVAQEADWTRLSTTGPSARRAAAMAYDSIMDRIILFGGSESDGSLKGDTWEWDGSSWTRLDVAGPNPRAHHVMAYDSYRGVVVLYGGIKHVDPHDFAHDTWEWDGYEWKNVTPSFQGLTGRSEPAMTFDSNRNVTLLYGGMDPYSRKGDFWEWDGNSWTQLPGGPGVRQHAELAYDSVRDRVVISGGYYSSSTWEWNGISWYAVSSAPGRTDPSLAFHQRLGKTVFFGGQTVVQQVYHNDTWEWDGSSWQHKSPVNSPGRRTMAATAYDSLRGRVVVFGGYYYDGSSHFWGDTWAYGSTLVVDAIFSDSTAGVITSENPLSSLKAGDDPRFTYTLNPGWQIDSVSTTTGYAVNNYREAGADDIAEDGTVTINVSLIEYTISAEFDNPEAGTFTSVNPLTPVYYGDSPRFTYTLNSGWIVESVSTTTGVAVNNTGEAGADNITDNGTITVNTCLYGPLSTFTRGTGAPVMETLTWESCGGPGILTINNGGMENGSSELVSSGVIYLNGKLIVGPKNFGEDVEVINIPITLLDGQNSIEVELRGKPGGKITIEFTKD